MWAVRWIIGLLFIFSGLVKANDPLGLNYKIQEFFEVWGWHAFHDYTLFIAYSLNVFEIISGVAVIVGWQIKIVNWLLLLLIIAFTFLTGFALFSGKIKNWKEVGGPDESIKLYGRENSSGTYSFFKDNVVKADYASSCQTLPGTAAVVNAVKKDKFGIGYGGAAYAEGVKHCKVKKADGATAYLPTAENIKTNVYPITRYLYMYLKNKPTGELKKYIDWILSPEGQKYVVEIGYFPVR